jgi:hypothetical protein
VIHFNVTQLKDKQVDVREKQKIANENEFIFIKDTDDFIVNIKEIITRHLNSSDEIKIIAAHNIDFFLTTYNFFNILKEKQFNWKEMFSAYQASKELKIFAKTINLNCLFTRFEASFKERYKEYECEYKSENLHNCLLCTLNCYSI